MISFFIGVGIVFILAFNYAVFKVSSKCSRLEEEFGGKCEEDY